MPITPNEALAFSDSATQLALLSLFANIDTGLRAGRREWDLYDCYLSTDTITYIQRTYEAAGWTVDRYKDILTLRVPTGCRVKL